VINFFKKKKNFRISALEHDIRFYKKRLLAARYPVYDHGTKVIIKGNNDNPYEVGTVSRHEFKHDYKNEPIERHMIIKLSNGSEVLCMGHVVKYDKNLAYALDKLTGVQQWNVMAKNYFMHDEKAWLNE